MTPSRRIPEREPEPANQAETHRAAVRDLQERRGAELYGFVRRLGVASDAANDTVQEALLRLWAALDAGDPIANVDGWAFRTTYRIAMDHHRGMRRVTRIVERLRPKPGADMQAVATDRIALWEAVDRLPERQRAAVYLRYRSDLSYDQIGAVMDISPVSARSHVSRALDRLGAILSREDFR